VYQTVGSKCDGEFEFPIAYCGGPPSNNVRWAILIPHRIGSLCVNPPSQVLVSDDVIDGKLLCISRFDQHVMGNFNSPSHVVGAHHPTMCDGEF
jgi:hypothetical protein